MCGFNLFNCHLGQTEESSLKLGFLTFFFQFFGSQALRCKLHLEEMLLDMSSLASGKKNGVKKLLLLTLVLLQILLLK